MAVIFITRMDGDKPVNEGLCLKCARELHIKPVDDVLNKMGLSDEELEGLTNEMMEALSNADGLMDIENTDSDSDDEGKTATFPFLNRLMGQMGMGGQRESGDLPAQQQPGASQQSGPTPQSAPPRNGKRKFLDSYCIDLTQRAREGKLDAMIGRAEELERVIQILNRRQKNNPCLIGEPGVGKTAIAEGLAQRIANGDVPYKLRDKEVYLLDLTALVAGTQFRGQFESRMKGLIEEIRKTGNIILVIDEVHNIVGAGDAEGSMNAANILKPALSRGEIQVIGATTFTEYRKHIEKDAALERRFQPVTVAEPGIEDSVKILEGIAHYYEECHQVRIPPEMCREAVLLSERYITDRYLPDKAIDLIDEACSDVNLKDKSLARIDEAQKEIDDLNRERDILYADTENEHYERLAVIRTRVMQLTDEINRLKAQKPALTRENLARVIELWTKIPASSINADEYERLAGLGGRLRDHIVGQDEAIDAVCAAIKRSRVGLQAKRKPVSFIFVGGTGVGKTELVKRLAEDLFNSPESLIRLDMSEFMEKFSVSRIIGSPPGYVGYDEAGQLTEKIRRRPYSVVLFDEIEKAHPDVMNILLQILDDGRITDAQGRTVNFENTVIIMTTNAGSNTKSGSLGFVGTSTDKDRERAMKALGEFLRPEFINRVDEIISFNKLTEENFRSIAALMLGEVRELMREKGMDFAWDDSVLDYLVQKSYSLTYGARNLRRTIQKEIEDVVAGVIVDQRRGAVKAVRLSAADGKINVEAE
ncbi:MAG TPA: ATP-dependent Clp protease ATP-binding subunit [Candidatus Scatomorpha merdipullorum]|uniref:ATP-dependent Clp protease ATP-binding subunit n=1 Tax=Candidatus Scatomorpha merdipullorum TaxID=2840927 RepID=A0A9D1FDJ7_9FIRM|nr:ATP-dependent Clp protease ATP-binding subunit [Candidatus Scatomorpha merdipullorum]